MSQDVRQATERRLGEHLVMILKPRFLKFIIRINPRPKGVTQKNPIPSARPSDRHLGKAGAPRPAPGLRCWRSGGQVALRLMPLLTWWQRHHGKKLLAAVPPARLTAYSLNRRANRLLYSQILNAARASRRLAPLAKTVRRSDGRCWEIWEIKPRPKFRSLKIFTIDFLYNKLTFYKKII